MVVRVLDGEQLAAESPREFDVPALLEVDLIVAPNHLHGLTEYQKVLADVERSIGDVAIADLREDDHSQDVSFLSGTTGWAPDTLTQLVVAHRLAALTSVDAAFFYALLREGTLLGTDLSRLTARFTIDLDTPIEPLFYDVVLLDAGTTRSALTAAIAQRVVPSTQANHVDRILETLARSTARAKTYYRTEHPGEVFAAVAANVAAGKHQEVLDVLREHGNGDPVALLGELSAIEFVADGGGDAATSAASQTLSTLLAADPRLLGDVLSLGGLGDAKSRTLEQTKSAAPGLPTGSALPEAADVDAPALSGTPAQANRMEKRFSTAAFAADLAATDAENALPNGEALLRLLRANPHFDLATGSIDDLLSE